MGEEKLKSAPLRKVIDRDVWVEIGENEDGVKVRAPRWKLECSHLVRPPTDLYGDRFPNRMRCGECQKDAIATGGVQ